MCQEQRLATQNRDQKWLEKAKRTNQKTGLPGFAAQESIEMVQEAQERHQQAYLHGQVARPPMSARTAFAQQNDDLASSERPETTCTYSHMTGSCLFDGDAHKRSGLFTPAADRFTTTSSIFFAGPRHSRDIKHSLDDTICGIDRRRAARVHTAKLQRVRDHSDTIKHLVQVIDAKNSRHAAGRIKARAQAKLRYVHEIESNERPTRDPSIPHPGDTRLFSCSQPWFKTSVRSQKRRTGFQ